MAAPIGNQFALGNEGGRPPIYSNTPEDIKKLEDLCKEYFTYIQGEYVEDEFETEDEEFEIRKKTIRSAEPPTVTGLTLFLGFASKVTLYEYAKKEEFSNPIKSALTRIEQYHEIAASMGDKCTGNIFILKNFGWHDTVKTETTMSFKNPPKIEFVDSDDED